MDSFKPILFLVDGHVVGSWNTFSDEVDKYGENEKGLKVDCGAIGELDPGKTKMTEAVLARIVNEKIVSFYKNNYQNCQEAFDLMWIGAIGIPTNSNALNLKLKYVNKIIRGDNTLKNILKSVSPSNGYYIKENLKFCYNESNVEPYYIHISSKNYRATYPRYTSITLSDGKKVNRFWDIFIETHFNGGGGRGWEILTGRNTKLARVFYQFIANSSLNADKGGPLINRCKNKLVTDSRLYPSNTFSDVETYNKPWGAISTILCPASIIEWAFTDCISDMNFIFNSGDWHNKNNNSSLTAKNIKTKGVYNLNNLRKSPAIDIIAQVFLKAIYTYLTSKNNDSYLNPLT